MQAIKLTHMDTQDFQFIATYLGSNWDKKQTFVTLKTELDDGQRVSVIVLNDSLWETTASHLFPGDLLRVERRFFSNAVSLNGEEFFVDTVEVLPQPDHRF